MRTIFLLLLVGCGGVAVNPTDAGVEAEAGCPSPPSPQTPEPLAQKVPDVSGLATDGNIVYWAEDSAIGSVVGCATTGCGGTPSTYAQTLNPFWVVADAPSIYWFEGPSGTIFKCLGGSTCTSSTKIISGLFNPWNTFAVGGGRVYFSVMGGPLVSCPDTGCTGGLSSATVIAPVGQLASVAATASTVAWRDGTGSVFSCASSGCATPTTISSQPDSARGIAANAAGVYWTNAPANAIMMCPASGCTNGATTLASSQSIVGTAPIAVDASGVYWSTTDGIMQVDPSGCAPPRLVGTYVGIVTAIALDAANVYFATKVATQISVWKVSK
jgi:hypothetical protein